MGSIRAEGRLGILPGKTVEVFARCAGSISRYAPRSASPGASQKPVLAIVSQELIELQQRFVDSAGNADLADCLMSLGMTERQVRYAFDRKKPLKAVTLSCPVGCTVSKELPLGAKFATGNMLFEYGPLVALCEIAAEHARHIAPKARVIVAPKLWHDGQRELGGQVVDLRESMFGGPGKRAIIVLDEAVVDYAAGTEVAVLISLPGIEGEFDSRTDVAATLAAHPVPVSMLPPRGVSRSVEVRQAEHRAREAQNARRPAIEPTKIASAPLNPLPPAPTPREPEVQLRVGPDVPRLTLSEGLWTKAMLRTILVTRRVLAPAVRVRGRVGPLHELDLPVRPFVDRVHIQILPTDPEPPYFVEVRVNSQQYAELSKGVIAMTLELASGPLRIKGKPYGTHRDKWNGLTVFGVELPRDVRLIEGDRRPWVGLSTSQVEEATLVVPTAAVKRMVGGQGLMLAHIDRGTLAALAVDFGRIVGLEAEITGVAEKTAIVADLADGIEHIRRVTEKTTIRRKAEVLLAKFK